MTHPDLIERITRSLAYMLRHQPEQFDLQLDEYGWADLDEVVRALHERLGEEVSSEDVMDAISAGDRQRYEIDAGRIRALYGHSIPVKPGEPVRPPEHLYLGLSRRDADRAERNGLRPGRRQFLHLALSREDALESAQRNFEDCVLMEIQALDAWEDGISFYDRRALFLSDPVPPQHLVRMEPRSRVASPAHAEEQEELAEPESESGGEVYESEEAPSENRPTPEGDGGGQRRGRRGRRGRGRGRDRERGPESQGSQGPPARQDAERPAYREDRPAYREDRPAPREERPAYREERPAYREDRPRREDRPAAREDRPRREERPAYREERPAYREDRPAPREERPAYREDRPAPREERPAYREDRPAYREDRPAYREDRPRREDRPAAREDRPRREERPAFREDRPRREDRPLRAPAHAESGAEGFGEGLREEAAPPREAPRREPPRRESAPARPAPPPPARAAEQEEDNFGAGL